jgi:hypothetical protein
MEFSGVSGILILYMFFYGISEEISWKKEEDRFQGAGYPPS